MDLVVVLSKEINPRRRMQLVTFEAPNVYCVEVDGNSAREEAIMQLCTALFACVDPLPGSHLAVPVLSFMSCLIDLTVIPSSVVCSLEYFSASLRMFVCDFCARRDIRRVPGDGAGSDTQPKAPAAPGVEGVFHQQEVARGSNAGTNCVCESEAAISGA